jgi:hypothetical protein
VVGSQPTWRSLASIRDICSALLAAGRLAVIAFDWAEPARRTHARAHGPDGNPRSSRARLGWRGSLGGRPQLFGARSAMLAALCRCFRASPRLGTFPARAPRPLARSLARSQPPRGRSHTRLRVQLATASENISTHNDYNDYNGKFLLLHCLSIISYFYIVISIVITILCIVMIIVYIVALLYLVIWYILFVIVKKYCLYCDIFFNIEICTVCPL